MAPPLTAAGPAAAVPRTSSPASSCAGVRGSAGVTDPDAIAAILEAAPARSPSAAGRTDRRGALSSGEVRVGAVAVGDHAPARRGGWPLDTERGVVPAHPARGVRDVAGAHQVVHLAVLAERLEAVRESGGDVQPEPVALAELDAVPAPAGRRPVADVDGDIEDRAADTAHHLGLAVGVGLVVHAAKRACACVERGVRLDHLGVHAAGAELLAVEGPGEPAALVREPLWLDDDDAGQRGL